jgi:hypothetical protein
MANKPMSQLPPIQAIDIGGGVYALASAIVDAAGAQITTFGGASTVADGADVTLGAKADAKSTATDATAITAMQVWKQISASVQAPPAQKGVGATITVTLTVTNGAYSIADVVGGLITFAGAASAAGKRAVINSLVLSGVVAIPYELWLFASDITTPAADNAVFALVAADAAQCKGVIPISSADYCAAQSAFNVATVRGVGKEYNTTATTLYGYLKATAVTSPGTTTLTLTLDVEFID